MFRGFKVVWIVVIGYGALRSARALLKPSAFGPAEAVRSILRPFLQSTIGKFGVKGGLPSHSEGPVRLFHARECLALRAGGPTGRGRTTGLAQDHCLA
jgi:hypothetical protein